MTILTEGRHSAEFVISEAECDRSRAAVTVAAGQNLTAGAVLGLADRVAANAVIPTVTAAAGSSGNGTMTLLTFGPDVQVGKYTITCIEAVAHGGVFSVVTPDGAALPDFAMGTTTGATARYTSSHLSFSLTDNTDFEVGDKFEVTVKTAGVPVVVGTGNGVMSLVSLGAKAKPGTYQAVCTVAGTHTSTWVVRDPDGQQLAGSLSIGGDGQIGVFASDQINFSITDGSTDFAVNAYFNVIVARPAAVTAAAWNPAATDGTQYAHGILRDAVNASSAAAAGVALVRDAQVDAAALAWGAAVTAGQHARAIAQLAAAGVIVR